MIREGLGRGFEQGYRALPPGGRPGIGGRGLFFPAGGLALLVLLVAFFTLVVIAFWQIYKKAGYEGGLSLLMLIPLVNIGAMVFLAFSEWPVLRQLRDAGSEGAPGAGTTEPKDLNAPEAEPSAEDAETAEPPAEPAE